MPHADSMVDQTRSRRSRVLVGFGCALAAGTLWGTTGPLSTALYAEGAHLTAVGFWRIAVALAALAIYGRFQKGFFFVDRQALLLIGLGGGILVALFEVAFQYAIAGIGVAGAVAMLYTAPVAIAILAKPLLGEALTARRLLTAAVVMVGVYLAVNGGEGSAEMASQSSRLAGIIGGALAALSYAGSTLLARYAVPQYGSARVLFLELVGGVIILGIALPLTGHTPVPPSSVAGWLYILGLGAGAVIAANFFFFAATKRIDAAPTAVAASIEPVVGALLALALFGQQLTALGWMGLALVVGGVAAGYLGEKQPRSSPIPSI
ncbi:MAG: EamA family transporter [Longimicrobiales bacterium]